MTLNARSRALIALVPEEMWDELIELRRQITTTRGWTPLDADARIAGDRYFDLVKEIHEVYGITLWTMATSLGLNGRTIKHWMFMHGFEEGTMKRPPSIKPYRGVVIDRHAKRGPHPTRLQPGSTCRSGRHVLAAEDIATYGNQRTCRPCQRERNRLQYLASKAVSK